MKTRKNTYSLDEAVEHVIQVTNGHVVLALPLGLGKANQFVNALYQRAKSDSSIYLEILTALSLSKPRGKSELEKRFLTPFVERVYGDYAELEYLSAVRSNSLPPNVSVYEFFVQPGSELNNAYAQQHYINTNYTHVARDLNMRGVNVVAQLVASRSLDGQRQLSLSCNPEVTLDLLPLLEKRKEEGEAIVTVGQVHDELPFMANDALVEDDFFDVVIEDPACQTTLFSTPCMPVEMAEHFIGLHASRLVKDGGTLQIGIGALGDAVTSALLLRHEDNQGYHYLLTKIAELWSTREARKTDLPGPFSQGLYGCSEMFTYGLFELFRRGILKRKVSSRGRDISLHAGFFLGPSAFYQGLKNLDDDAREQICMGNISFVNHLHGDEALKRSHRKDACFINTAFTVTLMGAAVADQLENGRMLSGVGGQYNFVAQAHELEEARSILLLRATRESGGECLSNIVWNYGHTTIPRHLRDIVITEYGIADLRAKTDSEVIKAMLNITDSRFQQELLDIAKANLKVEREYTIPSKYRQNRPARLQSIYQAGQQQGYFLNYPLGTDFTEIEQQLLSALSWLKSKSEPRFFLQLARSVFNDEKTEGDYEEHLERMGLENASTLKERLYKQLTLAALKETTYR